DRAAAREDAAHLRNPELHRVVLQRAPPTVAEAQELVTVLSGTLTDNGTDHGVETRAVSPAGKHTYTHERPFQRTAGIRSLPSVAPGGTPPRRRAVGRRRPLVSRRPTDGRTRTPGDTAFDGGGRRIVSLSRPPDVSRRRGRPDPPAVRS